MRLVNIIAAGARGTTVEVGNGAEVIALNDMDDTELICLTQGQPTIAAPPAYPCDSLSAWSMSALMSSMSSIPIESRT